MARPTEAHTPVGLVIRLHCKRSYYALVTRAEFFKMENMKRVSKIELMTTARLTGAWGHHEKKRES